MGADEKKTVGEKIDEAIGQVDMYKDCEQPCSEVVPDGTQIVTLELIPRDADDTGDMTEVVDLVDFAEQAAGLILTYRDGTKMFIPMWRVLSATLEMTGEGEESLDMSGMPGMSDVQEDDENAESPRINITP